MQRIVLKGVALATFLIILMTGCATIESNPKTTVGAVGGGVLGGLIAGAAGGNAATIAASTVGGILLGGIAGHLWDQHDKRLAAEAAQKALETAPTGRSVVWRNPDNEHSGTVTPVKTYQTGSGTYCREYEETVTIAGKKEKAYGTACRQPDGTWRIVNE